MNNQPGSIIHGRYRIAKKLGEGGFGTMYRVWDITLGRVCALKENLDPAPAVQRQFLREAKILANLNHPNLPRVTDYFIDGPAQFLVMDFVEGQDLQEMLDDRGGPLLEDHVLPWIRQICDALTYLHSQKPPIIHRDIKPANIKVTPEGQAVLVDFGIAKLADPSQKTTVGAQAVTPGFSPYEQYGKGATDARTDIYALGATLYTLLTGAEPPESVQRVTQDPLTLVRQVNPNVSLRTASAIMRALQMDPTRRFQSAADFKSVLNPPRPVVPPAGSPRSQTAATFPAAPPRSARGGPAAAAMLMALLVLLGLAAANAARRLPSATLAAVSPLPNGTQSVAPAVVLTRGTAGSTPTDVTVIAPSPSPVEYVVRAGDTCSEIADLYDVRVDDLASLNGLPPDCGVIYAGQTLLVPAVSGVARTPAPRWTATPAQPIATQVAQKDGMTLVYVPAGEFQMGSEEEDLDISQAETPAHPVYLRAFWIDRLEVTNAMYARCVADEVCRLPAEAGSKTRTEYYADPAFADYPVIWVAWEDADAYCKWAGRRLPTEAEWEKAARGTDRRPYPWGWEPPDRRRANFNNQVGDTSIAGGYVDGAGFFGALNMAGNVAEWVTDWFGSDYYDRSPYSNPTGPEDGQFRVIRGGSWYSQARSMRAAFRLWNYPDLRSDTVGFRCAR